MSKPNNAVQFRSTAIGGHSLLLDLLWEEDRFATQLYRISGPEKQLVCRSVEGDAQQTWPPSSPLQEVVPQTNAAGPYLAGIGKAGTGHWSVIMARAPEVAAIEFDFACRIASPADWVGSTYEILHGMTAVEDSSVLIETAAGPVLCEATSPECNIHVNHQSLQIRALDSSPGAEPRTIRWKYRLGLM